MGVGAVQVMVVFHGGCVGIAVCISVVPVVGVACSFVVAVWAVVRVAVAPFVAVGAVWVSFVADMVDCMVCGAGRY